MFRNALIKRRAVIPASGYYEWKTTDEGKTPHYIHPADGSPLFFAGLYEWWKNPALADDDPARWVLSCTILTRDAIGRLGSIHDRMPLFMDPDFADAWLDPTTENVGDVLDAAIDAAPDMAETLDDHVSRRRWATSATTPPTSSSRSSDPGRDPNRPDARGVDGRRRTARASR